MKILIFWYFISLKNDASLWNIAFSTTSAVYFVGGLVYLMYGSGEIQEWNYVAKN